jgi:predicted nucleic acid-binding protein
VPHVFVETNWLFAYAAPPHRSVPAAAELLDRARRGDFTLYIPNICLGEARATIIRKCQPRSETDPIRRFVRWAQSAGHMSDVDSTTVRAAVDKYESAIKRDLDRLDDTIRTLAGLPYVTVFGLDEAMLARSTQLAFLGIAAEPFDQAILAAVLVAARRLWDSGAREIYFCETDGDLQPFGKSGVNKRLLKNAFDESHVWVYGDFTLSWPLRKEDFE